MAIRTPAYKPKDLSMKPVFKSLVLAGLLATTGMAAFSQSTAGTAPMGDHSAMMKDGGMMDHGDKGRMGKMDSAKMEAMVNKHLSQLKTKLKITAAQESAWTTFAAAMKPTGNMMQKHEAERAEMAKLTTPERIDKMHSLRAQHMADMTAAMDKRDEATKTFYAALSADQKKTFDAEHARMGAHGN
jgi:hypothetical protein